MDGPNNLGQAHKFCGCGFCREDRAGIEKPAAGFPGGLASRQQNAIIGLPHEKSRLKAAHLLLLKLAGRFLRTLHTHNQVYISNTIVLPPQTISAVPKQDFERLVLDRLESRLESVMRVVIRKRV